MLWTGYRNIVFLLMLCYAGTQLGAQDKDYRTIVESNRAYRAKLNREYADTATSPLPPAKAARFDSLPFYPVDTTYYLKAHLERVDSARPFAMKTTTGRKARYRVFGYATFRLNGKMHRLAVYQNLRLLRMKKYKDYLFLPFTDRTNGESTYAGGRYIELSIPENDTLIIDFNKAYNPYCAYNARYSCPIPPRENHLKTAVKAGVRYDE